MSLGSSGILREGTHQERNTEKGGRGRVLIYIPDEEGADGDEVCDGEPELPAVDVDAGAEGAERLGVLLLPALHELAQLLGVLGRVEHVHVEAAVAHLVVQVDGVARGAIAEAHLGEKFAFFKKNLKYSDPTKRRFPDSAGSNDESSARLQRSC